MFSSFAFSDAIQGSYYNYTIKKGNNPQDIAKIFGLSLSEIERLNPSITKHWLYGKTIHLPLSSNLKKYIIQRGESIYSIAKRFQIPVSSLQKTVDTNIQKNMWVGTTIYIPIPSSNNAKSSPKPEIKMPSTPSKTTYYAVEKGDTYYSIARKFHIDVKTLENMNNQKPLLSGTRIPVPSSDAPVKKIPPPTSPPFFSGKLLPPYKGPSHVYSSLAAGLTYKMSKSYGSTIVAPLSGYISHIAPFLGFGTGIFIQNGDTTVVLASKGFARISVTQGHNIDLQKPLARGQYGYTLYLFRIKNGAIIPPF